MPEGNISNEFTLSEVDPDFNVPTAIAVSADGNLIAVGQKLSDTQILRTQDGAEVAVLADRAPVAIQFRHDDKLLTTGAEDGTIRLIRVPAGRELARIQQGKGVTSVALSDSGLLVTGDDLGSVRLWSTDLDAMLEHLCNSNGRNLSRKEWIRSGYLNDFSWRPTCENWPTPKD